MNINLPNIFQTKPQDTVASVIESFTSVVQRLQAVRDRELQTAQTNRMVAEAAKNAAIQNEAEAAQADKIASKLTKLLEG